MTSPTPEPQEPPRSSGDVRTCDVLVVGGGPCGLFLGALLAQRQVDVVVLEGRPEKSAHSRAIGLHPPALAALHTLGLEERAVAEGVAIRAGVARSGGRELGGLTFERAWVDRPFVLALPQHRTEELLSQRLTGLSPHALQRGWEVVRVHEDRSGVLVTARSRAGGGRRDPTGTAATWRARVVVGADGTQSLVRQQAGIRTSGRAYRHTYLMGDFCDTTADAATAVLYLDGGGIVESFPLPGRVRRWVAHTGPVLGEPSPGLLAHLVERRTGHRLDVASNTMISAFSVRRRIAERMLSGRTVVVGDAAHEISPIGGQGMTLGWLDSLALAPLLVPQVRGADAGPLTELPGFRQFERTRLRAARRAALRAELNMTAGRPLPSVAVHVRDGAVRAVLGTPLRHRLASAFTMRWAEVSRRRG